MQDASRTTQYTRLAAWIALAVGALGSPYCFAGAAVTTMPSGEQPTLRLLPTAVVDGEQVTLKDIADLKGDTAQLARQWVIANAPMPGREGHITIEHVEKVLRRNGANLALWKLHGATRCDVSRPANIRRAEAATTDVASRKSGQRIAEGSPLPLSVPDAEPGETPNTLRAILTAHIADRIAHLKGRPILDFSPAIERFVAFSAPTYRFQIKDRDKHLLGFLSFEVTVFEGDEERLSMPVLTQVSLAKPVVVAAETINRGVVISKEHLRMQERIFDRTAAMGLSDVEPLLGQRAKQLIRESEIIHPDNVEPLPLIERNDLVTVWVRRGNFAIKGIAKAMTAGGYGETVKLKNEASKETFSGIVTGRKTVEVTANATTAEPGLAGERGEQ